MGTVVDKLNYLNDTKSEIRQAIIDKGVTVEDSDTFRDYADKIRAIQTGESSGTDTITFNNYVYGGIEANASGTVTIDSVVGNKILAIIVNRNEVEPTVSGGWQLIHSHPSYQNTSAGMYHTFRVYQKTASELQTSITVSATAYAYVSLIDIGNLYQAFVSNIQRFDTSYNSLKMWKPTNKAIYVMHRMMSWSTGSSSNGVTISPTDNILNYYVADTTAKFGVWIDDGASDTFHAFTTTGKSYAAEWITIGLLPT